MTEVRSLVLGVVLVSAVEEESALEVSSIHAISASGAIRTYLIFLDVPYHFEYQVTPLPLLPEGVIIHFDMRLSNPKSPDRVRNVEGPYRVERRKLIYSTKKPSRVGLTQYLELLPSSREEKSHINQSP